MIPAHCGLDRNPFSQDSLTLLRQQQDVFDTLRVHCQQGGLCLVVGEPGTGKSVLKHALVNHDPKRLITPVVNRTLHTYHSVLRILCEAFQIDAEGRDFRCEKRLIEEAHRINHAGKMLARIIDDAHLIDVRDLRSAVSSWSRIGVSTTCTDRRRSGSKPAYDLRYHWPQPGAGRKTGVAASLRLRCPNCHAQRTVTWRRRPGCEPRSALDRQAGGTIGGRAACAVATRPGFSHLEASRRLPRLRSTGSRQSAGYLEDASRDALHRSPSDFRQIPSDFGESLLIMLQVQFVVFVCWGPFVWRYRRTLCTLCKGCCESSDGAACWGLAAALVALGAAFNLRRSPSG